MKRSQGSVGIALIECINTKLQKYRVRWDYQEVPSTDEQDNSNMVSFMEEEFLHKPTLQEVKDVVLNWYNNEIDNTIYSTFTWNGHMVWLDSIAQLNFKASYDLAKEGLYDYSVPFKFGTMDNPTYYTFSGLDELREFYLAAVQHVSDTLAEGWKVKDAIDWNAYQALLEKEGGEA